MNKIGPSIYILANKAYGTLYTGVTNNLIKRIYEHKTSTNASFTRKYDCNKLVYYEIHGTIENAINREKQIKAGNRNKKIDLILSMNEYWKDLYYDLIV